MFISLPLLLAAAFLLMALAFWCVPLVAGRNPVPFPDRGWRIFSAVSPHGQDAIVALRAARGVPERVQFNSPGVLRSIRWNGTIINCPSPEAAATLGNAAASIGLVASDPVQAATAAAAALRTPGFSAQVVTDAEPELPIAFVVTDALTGIVLNFRKHVIHLPRPTRPPRR